MFVFDAWKKSTGAGGKIEFLADGNGDFAKALDLALDGSGIGLGTRSKRYAMLVEDGVVKKLNIEDAPGKAEASGADSAAKADVTNFVPSPRTGQNAAKFPRQYLFATAWRRFRLSAASAAAVAASAFSSACRSYAR